MNRIIDIPRIELENSPMARAGIDEEVVSDYVAAYEAHKKMPPLTVFEVEGKKTFLLADGRHRLEALNRLHRKSCLADVHFGDYDACLAYALIANTTHGKRRTNADKRQCALLAIGRWPDKSNREIAERINVSHSFVDIVRNEMRGNVGSQKPKSACEIKTEPPVDPSDKPLTQVTGTTPATPPKPEVVTDIMGYPIPAKVLPYFKRMDEIKKWINELHAIHRNIMIFADLRDVLWIGVNFQDVDVYTHNLVTTLRRALPEVVCVQCQGHPEINPDNKCPRCHGKGLISKFDYDLPTVSDQMRKLREKAIDAITEKHKQQKGTYAETRQSAA